MVGVFEHPTLGKILPKSGLRVSQFLGLKYASLKNGFAPPVLYAPVVSNTVIDASKHGPSVISPPTGCEMEFGFIQKSLPSPPFAASGVDGLNLNVTVPAGSSKSARLPVFVFIHGGGFGVGGNSWPQYDQIRLVELSIELNEPIIAININYRVGAFGFLTSEELRSAGYLGNNGLRDQQVAFEWIKKNIEGFGGDPENIAVGGESAGGGKLPAEFARAISFGGTALLMKPLPPFVHEMTYKTVLEKLEINATSAEKRVSTLLAMPPMEFMSKLPPNLPLQPVIDGDTIPGLTTFQAVSNPEDLTMPGKQWCKALLIGDSQLDASIMMRLLEGSDGRLVDRFIESMTRNLEVHAGTADSLFKAYGINTSLSDEAAASAILDFITDIGFLAPTIAFAKGFPKQVYTYFFNEPNPWEGPFKGHATHILDVAFLFQNYNEVLGSAQKASAKAFAIDLIRFVRGKAPWTAFNYENFKARVYGPSEDSKSGVVTVSDWKTEPAETKRRTTIFQFEASPGLDVISNALGMFLGGH